MVQRERRERELWLGFKGGKETGVWVAACRSLGWLYAGNEIIISATISYSPFFFYWELSFL